MADGNKAPDSTTLPKSKSKVMFSTIKNKFKKFQQSTEARTHLSNTAVLGRPSSNHRNDSSRPGTDDEQCAPAHENQGMAGVVDNGNATTAEAPNSSSFVAAVAHPLSVNSIEKGPTAQNVVKPELYSTLELWNVAYDELKLKEEKLIQEYEERLRGDLTTMLGATIAFSGSKVERKDLMRRLLIRKIDDIKENTWKLKFGGQEIPVKDLAQPVVGIIQWADDYISGALNANPYASVAWAGVSLLLPLTLNPSKQAASLAKCLDYVSDLIVRSTMRESLYERRYGSQEDNKDQEFALSSYKMYQDTLKSLYVEILKFQASSICYLSKNSTSRLGLDVVKHDDWDSSLNKIQGRENAFCKVYEILKDTRDQEIREAVFQRHREKIEAMGSISCNIIALQKSVDDKQREAERKELLNWLSSIDPSENHNTALRAHQEGTGDWLLQGNDDFETWKTKPNSLLWLNGKAGSGNASVIQHLRGSYEPNPENVVAFFYFSFTDGKKQDTVEMLSSIVKQLCCRRPDTPTCVEALRQYKEKGQRSDLKTLASTLLAALHGFTHVHLVLDALDECPYESGARETLLCAIHLILEKKPDNLHLFLTSRREVDIEAGLKPLISIPPLNTFTVDINLSTVQDALDLDIGLHIDQKLNAEPFRSWPNDVKEEAKTALIRNADGMFQYVSCQFDALRGHRGKYRIREALRDLPKGLDATYDRMLRSIDPRYQKQVASILKWLSFSCRPLLVEELAEAFILDPEKAIPFNEDDRLFNPEEVLAYLPGLVVKVPVHIDQYSDEYFIKRDEDAFQIRFVHFSVKEYLSSTRMTQEDFSAAEKTSHLHISESCLAYHLQLSASTLATKNTLKQFALWEYTARNWSIHLEEVARELWTPSLVSHATQALSANSQSLLNMVRVWNPGNLRNNLQTTPESLVSPLYYAASTGVFKLASLLIHNGADVNEISPDGREQSPLQAAAYKGHKEIIGLLLHHHASIHQEGGYFGNALQVAAFTGRQDIIQLLLDRGAERVTDTKILSNFSLIVVLR
ncbi:hypothetical protein G7Y89_g7914 [Cudoniella acicularis]|uniref:NACHT domain-containing protein n=1 Tax=Cudoniella acicularis TaxID=354080 RepID=A0A8H4W1K8_9HELO|nr:hypothetical protein G7Y89_g7914 [Cudoniella acicularis]